MSEDFSGRFTLYGPTKSVDCLIQKLEAVIEDWSLNHEKYDYLITNFESLQFSDEKRIDVIDDLILTQNGSSCFAELKTIYTRRRAFVDNCMIDLSREFPDVFIEAHTYGDCSGIRDFLIKGQTILAQRILSVDDQCHRRSTKLMEAYRLKDLVA